MLNKTSIKRMNSNLTQNVPQNANTSQINWNDFINLQNQYREKVSEDYKHRADNIKHMHGLFFEEQIKENRKK